MVLSLLRVSAELLGTNEEKITTFRRNQSDDIIDGDPANLVTGWAFFTGISCCFVIAACMMTMRDDDDDDDDEEQGGGGGGRKEKNRTFTKG